MLHETTILTGWLEKKPIMSISKRPFNKMKVNSKLKTNVDYGTSSQTKHTQIIIKQNLN